MAPALQLPVFVLLQQHSPHQAGDRRIVGEDADDAGAALGFLVTRSGSLVFQILRQWGLGNWRKASKSSRASCISSAALGKRSSRETARSSQRLRISPPASPPSGRVSLREVMNSAQKPSLSLSPT